jgi:acyl-CoA dehydrogenase
LLKARSLTPDPPLRPLDRRRRAGHRGDVRAEARVAFGMLLAEQGVIRDRIAEARARAKQLGLLVLKAAWLMDTRGNGQRIAA